MSNRRRKLDLESYPLPPETCLLAPEWVAALSIYWRVQGPLQARAILDLAEAAARESAPERSVYLLQKALRQLGLLELSLLRLILSRYVEFVREGSDRPAQQIAAEVLATLLAVERSRARGGRPRKAV